MSRTAFLFPGQGSQQVGMGRDFYEHYEKSREIFSLADKVLGFGITRMCFEGPEEELMLTMNTQPALLLVSHVAFSLLEIQPEIAAGHSLGEYSALVAAGALSFSDALLLVRKRGRYMQEAVPVGVGAMAALLGSAYEDVTSGIGQVKTGTVEIANWNSQDQIVISGNKLAVEEAVALIRPPRSVMLPVSAPFHCRLMKSAEEKLEADLEKVEFRDLRFPVVTNVDARIIRKGHEARDALKRQVTRPVLWFKSMERMADERMSRFVELGSGRVLYGLMRRIARDFFQPVNILNVENRETLEKTKEALSGAA